jgi:hypothetical protein
VDEARLDRHATPWALGNGLHGAAHRKRPSPPPSAIAFPALTTAFLPVDFAPDTREQRTVTSVVRRVNVESRGRHGQMRMGVWRQQVRAQKWRRRRT